MEVFKIDRSRFEIDRPLTFDLEPFIEMVIIDFNNGKIKVNGADARHFECVNNLIVLVAMYYGTKKAGVELAEMLVQTLKNESRIFLLEVDGHKYLRMDVRQHSILTWKPL